MAYLWKVRISFHAGIGEREEEDRYYVADTRDLDELEKLIEKEAEDDDMENVEVSESDSIVIIKALYLGTCGILKPRNERKEYGKKEEPIKIHTEDEIKDEPVRDKGEDEENESEKQILKRMKADARKREFEDEDDEDYDDDDE